MADTGLGGATAQGRQADEPGRSRRRTSKRRARSPPGGGGSPSPSKRQSPGRRTVPDRWCLRQDTQGIRKTPFVIEYKAAHKLTPEMLRLALDGQTSDNTMFVNAIRYFSRKKAVSDAHNASASNTNDSTLPAGEMARHRAAQVLTQAYHYMIEYGLAYSYVASGEGLVFCTWTTTTIRRCCITTCQYRRRFCGFRWTSRTNNPVDAATEAQYEERLAITPIVQVLTLVLLALEKEPLSAGTKDRLLERLSRWPAQPENRSEGGGGAAGGGGTLQGPSLPPPPPSLRSSPASRDPTAHDNPADTAEIKAVPPRKAYCTQQCLRGLQQCGPLDPACPNVAAHRMLASATAAAPIHHVWTPATLQRQLQRQLAAHLDDSCRALDSVGKFGAVGALFHITVVPGGYTLVAEGLQAADAARVGAAEEAAYRQLDLVRPFRLGSGVAVTHMLLMSYAGEPLPVEECSDDERLWQLEQRLLAHGVEHEDLRWANVLWCREVDGPMVDSERSWVRGGRDKTQVEFPEPRLAEVKSSESMQVRQILGTKRLNEADVPWQDDAVRIAKRPYTAKSAAV
ncbi:hypothetical protein SCUCBS95973_007831 [Sporothrix curviconia]|uniref:Uncharacterized protein n=1 Tax=Sporothrix curviconia TaxID=1260050 RepID=A0ABP0CJE0_9PEZI